MPPLFFSRDVDRDPLLFFEGLDEEIEIYLFPNLIDKEFPCGVNKEIGDLVVEIRVDLNEDSSFLKADFDRFVDDFYRGADIYYSKEILDILRIESYTAMTHQPPHPPRGVSSMNAIVRVREPEPIFPQGIIRPRGD